MTAGDGRRSPAGRSLRTNFAWALAGNVIYAACQWTMLMALAKLGTREMVGQFAYALALTAPVTVLTNMNLRAVQATDAGNEFSFQSYFGLRVVGVIVALGTVAIMAARSSGRGLAGVLLAVGAAKGIEAISDVCYGLMQRYEHMDVIARSMIVKGIASAIAFAVAISATGMVVVGACALAATWGLVLVLYDVPHASVLAGSGHGRLAKIRPSLNPSILRRLWSLASPLAIVAFLLSLQGNVPRYFVEHALGLSDLGIFSTVTYVILAVTAVLGALGQAATPRLAVYFARGDRRAFIRLTAILAVFGCVLGIGSAVVVAVAGPRLLTLLYRPEYAKAQPVLLWAALSSIVTLVSSALGYSVTAMRSFRPQALLAVIVIGIMVAGCWGLVPAHGLLGAVAADALASAAQLGGQLILLRIGLRRCSLRAPT